MPIRGIITLPGDKSISHRALLISSLIRGKNYINNLSTSQDVEYTKSCLEKIGIVLKQNKSSQIVKGGTFIKPSNDLYCGNSGTTMRLLSGILGGLGIESKLTGDKSLLMRPMGRIVGPLKNMGINIDCNGGKPPMVIGKSDKFTNLDYIQKIPSAQVKSALLLAGICSNKKVVIEEKYKSRNHTEIMLKNIGCNINVNKNKIILNESNKQLNNMNIDIPGDISSASFYIGAACMIPNSDLRINNILLNDSRVGFIQALKKMGAGIIIHNEKKVNGEKVGDIQVYYRPLYGININRSDISSMIDEFPILSVVATQSEGMTIISGAEELRNKESDRIKAICSNLKAMGTKIIEKKDGFIIEGPSILNNTAIKSYGDHRIAMSFIIAGISSGNYNEIDDVDCIKSSFPEFIEILKQITR